MSLLNGFAQKQANGLNYYESGTGNTLILLHGLPENATLWRNIASTLAAHSHVIIPDLPGSGDSPLPDGPLTIESMATAVNGLLQTLQITDCMLVGHSMGGYVAMAMLEAQPDLFHCIAMVHSTAKADSDEKKEQRQKAVQLIRNGGKDEYLKASTEKLFATAFRKAHPKVYEEQLERSKAMPAEHLALYNEALAARPDRTLLLSQSKVPFQWILGDADEIIPLDDVLSQVALAEMAFLSLYKDVGHLSMIEVPERLAADLTRFSGFCSRR
ncbi:MAG: alpha/beta hydrolase [Sphingobacteriales bacterium]|nr:MAG: alpha/beta hydrolase [Sphingobacteriales bacterium]